MARGKGGGIVACGHLLPRRVYTAARDRPTGPAKCQSNLPTPFSRSLQDPADNRGGPPTFSGRDWLPARAAHLGPESHPHIHCVLPAGGISQDGSRWIVPRKTSLSLPVQVLNCLVRTHFIIFL